MSEKTSVEQLKDTKPRKEVDKNKVSSPIEPKAVQVSQSVSYQGPIPHPRILADYENVLPGAADRIIKMAEREQEHRHEFDAKCQASDSRDSLLGILFALFISLSTVGAGILIIFNVPSIRGIISGSVLSLSGLAAVVGSFLKHTQATWKNNK